MADWGSLLEGANPSRSADLHGIKQSLPLEWVLGQKGVMLEPSGDGRLVGLCPFHDDHESPSFAVFHQAGDALALGRVGCWSCDFRNGDLYDFLQRFLQVPLAQAVQHAAILLDEFRADTQWRSQAGEAAAASRPKADPADLLAVARQASSDAALDQTAILRLINEKAEVRGEPGWSLLTAEFLRSEWGVGVEQDWVVVVPHLSVGPDGGPMCRALKTRSARSHLIARTGSDLQSLYGEFRMRGHRRVVLCEGESDAWCASAAFHGQDVDVLALPSGASARPRDAWLALLAGKDVVVAFDGDRAGRVAARKWWFALSNMSAGPASLRFASLPDGKDLATVPDLARTVLAAAPVPPSVGNVSRDEARNVYVRFTPGRNEDDDPTEAVISNWALEPLRELELEDGSKAYEGLVNGRDVLLQSHNLRSDASTKAWAETVGGNWLGSSRDSAALLGNLQNEGPFLGRGRATSVLGWHDGHFVLPDGYIGPDYWRHVPPAASLSTKSLRIAPGDWDPRVLDLMLRLRGPAIMHPIIAWLFAAPLRTTFSVFPFLAVTGQSGSGKTTLIGTLLDKLGWKIYTTITGTTPHAILAQVGVSNGIPVWFDEYRPGSREESKRALDQVLRDAYDRSPTKKGGGSDRNPLAIVEMPTEAPIIVTGEDAFTETSHLERMVWVKLDRADKNRADLESLLRVQSSGLGYAYLRWLVDTSQAGRLPSLAVNTTIDRQTTNRQILEVGWSLFEAFYQAATGGSVGRPDLGGATANVSSAVDPTTEAMIWAQGQTAYGANEPVVQVRGDDVVVQLENFVQAAARSGVFTLPGGPAAIANILEANWGAVKRVDPITRQRLYVLPGMAGKLLDATVPNEYE